MRRFVCVIVVVFSVFRIFSQNPYPMPKLPVLDTAKVRVKYSVSTVPDTLNPNHTKTYVMILKIGDAISLYQDYYGFLSDSLSYDFAIRKIDYNTAQKKVMEMMSGTTPLRVQKNFLTTELKTIDRIPFDNYLINGKLKAPDWQLYPDTLSVGGYLCYKATTRLYGRDYLVWYTPEIPISDGPWKLFGLPGLILKAEDSKRHYVFECLAIEKPSWTDYMWDKSYKPFSITRERFRQRQKEYYDSPASVIAASGMVISEIPNHAKKAKRRFKY